MTETIILILAGDPAIPLNGFRDMGIAIRVYA